MLRLIALLVLIHATSSAVVAKELPHILLIMTDDMGWMDLHCQGNSRLNTPHIDALARDGTRFTNAYAASPVCSPTRAAFMTGVAPARSHITQHGEDRESFWPEGRTIQPPQTSGTLPLEANTLAERLKTNGYASGFFGKWHLGRNEKHWPTAQGFDVNLGGCGFGGPPTYFDPFRIPSLPPRKAGEYLTDRLADEAIGFMRDNIMKKPMFVCLWTYNPHYPFEAPEDLIAKYRGKEGSVLKNATYAAQLEATDRAVGRVLDEVRRLGMTQETLVIFTSDNGGWQGATDNRPLKAGKGFLYEGGLRVPLIIRWPGTTSRGMVIETPVITMDLAATVLEAAGVSLADDEAIDGENLRPLFEGGDPQRDALFFHYPHFAFHKANRPGSAIRVGKHKLILRYDDDSVELYDLDADLGETQDLSQRNPELAQSLENRLRDWLSETNSGLPVKVNTSD